MDAIGRMIDFYNEQVDRFAKVSGGTSKAGLAELAEKTIDTDAKRISWSGNLKGDLAKLKKHQFSETRVVTGVYRPFSKQAAYFDRDFNERVYQLPRIFPKPGIKNLVVAVSGIGAAKEFSALITDCVPNFHMHDTGQCLPLFLYEKDEPQEGELISHAQEGELVDGYRRRSAITDTILADFRAAYEKRITKEDIFYYVYGVLHSPEYRTRFASDLKKMLPRLPFTRETADFFAFS